MHKIANRIEEHMTEYPTLASENTPVMEAIEYMQKTGVRHLPVVENEKVIGVVSERDLKQAEILTDSMQLLVCDVMTANPYCVRVGTPLSAVAETMAIHKYGCVVVLNSHNQVVGIFTTTDGMLLLSKILASGHWKEAKEWNIEKFLKGDTLFAI